MAKMTISDVSISTACFVYKKSPKKRSKATKKKKLSPFQQEWNTIEAQIDLLHLHTYGQVFNGLLNFIRESPSSERSSGIIPTAVLITGTNVADHSALFSTLKRLIVDSVSPYVAFLTSNDAPNIKVLVSTVVQMILKASGDDDDDNDEEEEDDDEEEETEATIKRKGKDLIFLNEWLKRKTNRSFDRSIVVVLEAIETFDRDVIGHFIAILCKYIEHIPFVLVIGVSTSLSTVHDVLSQSSLSRLAIETFHSNDPTSYLDVVLKKILISENFPFKLSHRIVGLLEDVFFFNDVSVNTFVSGIKYCMMDYYYTNAFSMLCCDLESLDARIDRIGAEGLEAVRRLPSFRVYVTTKPLKEQKSLLLDDKHLKSVVRNLVTDLHLYHSEFFPMLYCIHAIVSTLPGFPLGKQLRELYAVCLQSDVVDNEAFKTSMKLLNLMAKDELLAHLKNSCAAIRDYGAVPLAITEMERSLAEIVEKLEAGDEQLEQLVQKTFSKPIELNKKISRSVLQQKLKEMSESKRPKSVFASLRDEAVNILKESVNKFLKCARNYPLHEIFYYDSVKSVESHFFGKQRTAVQMALAEPQLYLKCDCCSLDDEGCILESLPDICISYKLHLECGRLINLYDWLQAFITILEQSEHINSVSNKKKKKQDTQLMARFIRSVAELQFLGFIKGTTQKTDHVLRLTC